MCCCRIRSSLSAALSNVRMLHFPPNYSRIQYWPLQQIPLMWTYQFLNIKTKYWLRISTYWTGSDYSGTKCCSSHPSLSTVLQSDTRAARSLPRGLYRAPSATLWLRGSLRCAWAGPCRWGSAAGHCCSPCGPLLGQGCLRRPLGCTCWSIMSRRSPCRGPRWCPGVAVGGEWDMDSGFTMGMVMGPGCCGLLLYDRGLWRQTHVTLCLQPVLKHDAWRSRADWADTREKKNNNHIEPTTLLYLGIARIAFVLLFFQLLLHGALQSVCRVL